MKHTSLPLLACPDCHAPLTFSGDKTTHILSGELTCTTCHRVYPIVDGIPHFIEERSLTGMNRRFAHLYDYFSWFYALFSKVGFAFLGLNEKKARKEVTDLLDPQSGPILEVSIGPGVNLPYLLERSDVGEVFGLDISPGQLKRCQKFTRRRGWDVDLFLGNGEQLPFQDNAFAGILHIGGINFFNDKKAAIDEMIRVTKPGARILIADENEKGAKDYEKILPGFKSSFKGERDAIKTPIDLIPPEMMEVECFDIWHGFMYCILFRKPG
jgi:ubiquinone/menaquinone biosynthesis C-methylase UbiE/uncharacterized protein YbaR (Trm112 family)